MGELTDTLEFAATILGLGLYVVVLVGGFRKMSFATPIKATITVAEIVLAVVAIVLLGVWGIILSLVIVILGATAYSLTSAISFESLCASCAVNGRFESKEEANKFIRRLHKTHKAFRYLGLMNFGRLILRLCKRGRDPSEIEFMAKPIAMLHVAFDCDFVEVADQFDTILRRQRKPASEAMELADVITASTKASAATFEETLAALAEV